jgi:hypothetical protein
MECLYVSADQIDHPRLARAGKAVDDGHPSLCIPSLDVIRVRGGERADHDTRRQAARFSVQRHCYWERRGRHLGEHKESLSNMNVVRSSEFVGVGKDSVDLDAAWRDGIIETDRQTMNQWLYNATEFPVIFTLFRNVFASSSASGKIHKLSPIIGGPPATIFKQISNSEMSCSCEVRCTSLFD